jgi:hypothetical protein
VAQPRSDTDGLVRAVHAKVQAARGKRFRCTGLPSSCGKSYSVPADKETPVCIYTGAECDRQSHEWR